jgi:hypothetical protein
MSEKHVSIHVSVTDVPIPPAPPKKWVASVEIPEWAISYHGVEVYGYTETEAENAAIQHVLSSVSVNRMRHYGKPSEK